MLRLTTKTYNFVREVISSHFPVHVSTCLPELFIRVDNLYRGNYSGYQGSDSAYHDLHHTCDATETTTRLLDGHIKGGMEPLLTARDFELAIAAALLHDSGFIKQVGDNEGTGAKYTLIHVDRSADFAGLFLPPLGLTADEVRMVQNAIHFTGINLRKSRSKFRTPVEKYIGCVVGTADILSQMAAIDYPKHLPELYKEYVEAAAYSGLHGTGIGSYQSATGLMQSTRNFYEVDVKRMLNEEWNGVYKDLEHHFSDGTNPYLSSIETNLERIDQLLADPESLVAS